MESTIDRINRLFLGKRFGRLVVDEIIPHEGGPSKYKCNCTCDCGKKFSVTLNNIRYDNKISCGCNVDTDIGALVGEKFGMLTVTKHFLWEDCHGRIREVVLCRCDCGEELGGLFDVDKVGKGECDRCGACKISRRISAGHQGIKVEDWTGFKAPLSSKDRLCAKNDEWRCAVLKRDNWTCQCCGSVKRLEVHHIENFSDNKRKRFNIDNGITLCFYCHSIRAKRSFHRVYGTRKNNAEQLEKYISAYKKSGNRGGSWKPSGKKKSMRSKKKK